MQDNIILMATVGGVFSLLCFVHFFVDWICQSHSQAMQKHNNKKIRAEHCIVYMMGFVPILLLLKLDMVEFIISLNILFWSHMYGDSYVPVMFWAKYIRKAPEFDKTYENPLTGKIESDIHRSFYEFAQTTLGRILAIVIDQLLHLCFLFPIIYFALN